MVPTTPAAPPHPQVDAAGKYHSPIEGVGQRFGTMVGGLTTGRMLIAQVRAWAGWASGRAHAQRRWAALACLQAIRRVLPPPRTSRLLPASCLHPSAGRGGCHENRGHHRLPLLCGAPAGGAARTGAGGRRLGSYLGTRSGAASPALPACYALAPPRPARALPTAPQFNKASILDYISHQRRLFGGLAAAYALHLAMLELKAISAQVGG